MRCKKTRCCSCSAKVSKDSEADFGGKIQHDHRSHVNSELPQCKPEYTSLRFRAQIHDSAASLKKRYTRDTAVLPRQTELD